MGYSATINHRQQQAILLVTSVPAKPGGSFASISIAQKNVKYILKDADSAEFRNVGVIIPPKLDTNVMGMVCAEVNAKTGFGGYGGYTKFLVIAGIPVIDDGSVASHPCGISHARVSLSIPAGG